MINDTCTLLKHSSEAHRIEALYNALKLVGDMEIRQVRSKSWFDDLYYTDGGPEYEPPDFDSWMDDLDEAA
jgi:hypothetical protein